MGRRARIPPPARPDQVQRVLLSGTTAAPCVQKKYRDGADRDDTCLCVLPDWLDCSWWDVEGSPALTAVTLSPKELSIPVRGICRGSGRVVAHHRTRQSGRGHLPRRCSGAAGGRLDSPRLITTRRADFGAGRSEDGYVALDDVQIKARVESGPEGPVLVIKASSGHPDARKCEPISSLSFPSPVGCVFVPDLVTSKSEAALVPLMRKTNEGNVLSAFHRPCKVT